jgi:hypothetical protein
MTLSGVEDSHDSEDQRSPLHWRWFLVVPDASNAASQKRTGAAAPAESGYTNPRTCLGVREPTKSGPRAAALSRKLLQANRREPI